MNNEGVKHDQDKLRYDLIPPIAEEALASVLTHGAKKYGDNNWMSGIKFRRIFRAAKGHLNSYRKGKWIDDDSGLPHLWLAFTEIAFLIFYESHTEKYEEFNDFLEEWRATLNSPLRKEKDESLGS